MVNKRYEAKINSIDDFKILMKELESLDNIWANAKTLERVLEIKEKVKIVIDRIDTLLDNE